ncbi:MAG TPA: helix-turn-helix domain-containing protein [Acidimicrobiales bacterium]
MRVAPSKDTATGRHLKRARLSAGLSQSGVARRAPVAQSVISAYESGRREPSTSTLERLVNATGHRHVLDVERSGDYAPGLPDTLYGRWLRQRRRAVLACAARHGASNVRVFGSTARGADQQGSDIDLVVDLEPSVGLFQLEALRRELSQILGVSVDVAPSDNLRPRVRERVNSEAIPL